MLIQLVFLTGGFVLSLALLPTIFAGGGPTRSTCTLTATILIAYTFAFVYQNQAISALGTGCNALLWVVLLLQARKLQPPGRS